VEGKPKVPSNFASIRGKPQIIFYH
jgi:hypothetical protein